MARRLRAVVRPEFKHRDNVIPPTTIANNMVTSPNFVNLCQIPMGTGPMDREGRQILLKSVLFRGEFAGGESCRIRFIVVQDKRRSYNSVAGTMPAIQIQDLLYSTTYPMLSPYQLNQTGRYKVLMDQVVNYDHDDHGKSRFSRFWKFSSTVNFPNDTSAEANENSIYFYMICDASSVPSFAGYCRLRWVDN